MHAALPCQCLRIPQANFLGIPRASFLAGLHVIVELYNPGFERVLNTDDKEIVTPGKFLQNLGAVS